MNAGEVSFTVPDVVSADNYIVVCECRLLGPALKRTNYTLARQWLAPLATRVMLLPSSLSRTPSSLACLPFLSLFPSLSPHSVAPLCPSPRLSQSAALSLLTLPPCHLFPPSLPLPVPCDDQVILASNEAGIPRDCSTVRTMKCTRLESWTLLSNYLCSVCDHAQWRITSTRLYRETTLQGTAWSSGNLRRLKPWSDVHSPTSDGTYMSIE